MRVLFLIRSLHAGGAERQLVTLVRNLDPSRFSATVVTYYPDGDLASELQGLDHVGLLSAGKRGRWDLLGFLHRLRRIVRETDPHVIHGYMQGANELALFAALGTRTRVVWGVRASMLNLDRFDRAFRFLIRVGRWLAPFADAIIANSYAGRDHHIEMGYPERRFFVVPNGVDTTMYQREVKGSRALRAEWGVGDDHIVIGIAARIDPQKDHETFLRAAGIVCPDHPQVRFAIVGHGSAEDRSRLAGLAAQMGIADRVIWAGRRSDMPAVFTAFDIATSSSSYGEGTPNTLVEAMACETPCVATDIGDTRLVMGDTGEIVPPRHPQALAQAWLRVLAIPAAARRERGRDARRRVMEHFSVRQLVCRTESLLDQLAAGEEPREVVA